MAAERKARHADRREEARRLRREALIRVKVAVEQQKVLASLKKAVDALGDSAGE
jgi:hypothetical protein